MFETLKNAWKIQELRKKILFTLLILFIYRLGGFIPVPGIDATAIGAAVQQYSALGLMNLMSGGNLGNFTLFALGVGPYITASIIMQLLTVAIPKLEQMSKEGEEGRKKLSQITRIVGVAFALVETVGIVYVFAGSGAVATWFDYVVVAIALTAGAAICMWLGELITEKGIGNGTSLIIFVGIIAGMPSMVIDSILGLIAGTVKWWSFAISVVGVLAIILAVVFVDNGVRRIPVQYAKRVVGRKMYGGQSSHIPMKVNASGVMPIIFAMSLLNVPMMIAEFMPNSAFYAFYAKWLGPSSVIYMIVYGLLIVFFAYFYSAISFNPAEMSKNLQQNGGFIPGIRPGRSTSDYLTRTVTRLTLSGALFLAILAVIPSVITAVMGTNTAVTSTFTASGVLIMVSVALETSKTLESQMLMRNYKGFLK